MSTLVVGMFCNTFIDTPDIMPGGSSRKLLFTGLSFVALPALAI
jgi:hypothetical protein